MAGTNPVSEARISHVRLLHATELKRFGVSGWLSSDSSFSASSSSYLGLARCVSERSAFSLAYIFVLRVDVSSERPEIDPQLCCQRGQKKRLQINHACEFALAIGHELRLGSFLDEFFSLHDSVGIADRREAVGNRNGISLADSRALNSELITLLADRFKSRRGLVEDDSVGERPRLQRRLGKNAGESGLVHKATTELDSEEEAEDGDNVAKLFRLVALDSSDIAMEPTQDLA